MRIANHKIDSMIRELVPFTNYNATITARIVDRGSWQEYEIIHWRTKILSYKLDTNQILSLEVGYISQTTSSLVGRILRNLPRRAVEEYLPYIVRKDDMRRVRSMLRM
ncbi:MAG: hypothetical protein EBS38_01195 [Actinobacteria bacterium]|nr:hypothetical protein [Actinomycetota bacterium]